MFNSQVMWITHLNMIGWASVMSRFFMVAKQEFVSMSMQLVRNRCTFVKLWEFIKNEFIKEWHVMKLQIHCSINYHLSKHIVVTVATVLECLEKEILGGKQRMSKLRSGKTPRITSVSRMGQISECQKTLIDCLSDKFDFLYLFKFFFLLQSTSIQMIYV